MMKYLLTIITIFLFSTAFKNPPPGERWLATLDIYMTENQEFVIYYRGDVHRCISKSIIDALYLDCDSTIEKIRFDSVFHQSTNLIKSPETPKIKTEKI